MEDFENLWCPNSLPKYIKITNENGTEDVYYSAVYKDVPSEFKHLAVKELNETDENKTKGLRKLKEFLKKESLPDVKDNVLITILRVSKYNFKKSESKLEKFLRAREAIVSKLKHLDVEKAEKVFDDGGIGILPIRDKNGRLIIFTRAVAMDDDAYSKDEVMLTAMVAALALISYPLTTIAGVVYIGDSKFKSANSYIRLMQSYHQYMWTFLDLPVRLGRVEVTNVHYLVRCFVNMIRPFLSAKISSRISFYGSDMSELTKTYHPDILPEEFGGNLGPIDTSLAKNMTLDLLKKLKAESEAMKEAASGKSNRT